MMISLRRAEAGIAVMISGLATAPAFAGTIDVFDVTYLAPGVQTPAGITTYYETFDNVSARNGSITTNYGGTFG